MRELEELNRALAGDPAAEPELLRLVADVRAARPEPDPAFAARLDHDVAARFPRPEGERRRRPLLLWLAPSSAALAGLVAAVLVFRGGEAEVERPVAAGGGSSSVAQEAAPSGAADLAARAAPAPAPARAGGRRSVERAAELTLTAPRDEVQDVADRVVRETQAVGGYVAQSDIDVHDDAAEATFTLRVPSSRLDDALARLSRLASVGGLRQQATDITGAVDSAAGRLADARAERRALLRALGRAATERQIASLRARIADNRRRIARLESSLDRVRRRADLATVSVAVRGDGAAEEDEGGAWTPGDAAGDAWRILQVVAGGLLVGLAVLAPFALLALLARLGLRRRREAVLDG